jgi:tripartite-type tricarboxylate transporter receptor subunit TctC
MKKLNKLIVALLFAASTVVAGKELYSTVRAYTADYPDNNINGYVAWGAGGATDTLSRALSVYAADALGTNIIIQNKTGASGSVATEFVKRQDSNGYSILYNAENPPLYKVMGISNVDYDDYYPVLLVGQQTAVLVVAADSSYDTVEDLFEDAQNKPGELNLATTGAGALPANVASMMELTNDVSFNQVPYDGDAAVLTAILGGNADCTVVNYSAARDYVADGSIRILAAFSTERLEDAPDVPTICESYPEYEKFFPWGAFVGVFVDDDCSDNVKQTLSDAFHQAWETEGFQTYLAENYITPLGYSGEEAENYIRKWQQVTTWILYDAGQVQYSPADFGITRLEEE